jgi:hypothetical protein
MENMQYYKIVDNNPKSKNPGKAQGVFRKQSYTFERWNGKEWVLDNNLFGAVSGLGGGAGADYVEVTEQEAKQIMQQVSQSHKT